MTSQIFFKSVSTYWDSPLQPARQRTTFICIFVSGQVGVKKYKYKNKFKKITRSCVWHHVHVALQSDVQVCWGIGSV